MNVDQFGIMLKDNWFSILVNIVLICLGSVFVGQHSIVQMKYMLIKFVFGWNES